MAITGIKELFERSDASGSRSTILKPLTWFLSLIIGGLIISIKLKAPTGIIVLFAISVCLAILLFFFAYIYCLFKDPDALRSEKYSIQKMAIEKGIIGDNIVGIITNTKINKIGSADLSNQSEGGN